MMERQLFRLDAALPTDPNIVGGKGAGLGLLCRAGSRVPEGLVLAAGAIVTAQLGRELGQVIREIVDAFGPTTTFAVRSSAIVEDGRAASYAGMYRTVLGVHGDRVAAAVNECRRSVGSTRLVSYQQALNCTSRASPVAVSEIVACAFRNRSQVAGSEWARTCLTSSPWGAVAGQGERTSDRGSVRVW